MIDQKLQDFWYQACQQKEAIRLSSLYTDYLEGLGFEKCFYICVEKNAEDSAQPLFLNFNYPDEFIKLYDEEGYADHDALIHTIQSTGKPVRWHDVDQFFGYSQTQEKIRKETLDFGLNGGFSFPFVSDRFDFCGLTIASEYDNEFYRLIDSEMANVISSAHIFHNCVQPFIKPLKIKELTKRQLDVLRWLAEGKSSKQIASVMRIQEDTVNKHVQAIKEKLNSGNRIDAVSRLFDLELLNGNMTQIH